MKKLYKNGLLLLMVAFSVALNAQSGLTNLSFETTGTVTTLGCSGSTLFVTGFNGTFAGVNGMTGSYSLSTVAQNGSKYITINNLNSCGFIDLEPNPATISSIPAANSPGNGSPYTSKPASFCGYYRTQGLSTANDSVFVLVYLTKNGSTVGYGKFASGTNQSSWTSFCANINYISSLTPDTVRIRFTPSRYYAYGSGGAFFTSQTIYFDVDNCSFTGSVTTVAENETETKLLTVFPNPAINTITVELSKITTPNKNISVVNMLGQQVFYASTSENKILISTKEFVSGVYYVIVSNADQKSIQKVIITH